MKKILIGFCCKEEELMRRTVSGLLIISLLILSNLPILTNLPKAQGTVASDIQPSDVEGQNKFKFVSVTLVIKDFDGSPLSGAEVKAFSEDWGIRYPEFWFSNTDNNGVVTFDIPVGNWSFFAGGGYSYSYNHPGQGYFAMLKYTKVMDNSTLTIQPNDTITLFIYNVNSQSLDVNVRVIDSDHAPIVITPMAGFTSNGIITIKVNSGNRYHVALSGYSNSEEGYLMMQKDIESGSSIVIQPSSSNMTRLTFKIYDKLNNPTFGKVYINLLHFDILYANYWDSNFIFDITGQRDIYVTPELVSIWSSISINGWTYYFIGKEYDLLGNTHLVFEYGGPLNITLRVRAPDYFSDYIQIWFDVRDSYGNMMSAFYNSSGCVSIPITIWRGTNVIYNGDIGGTNWWSALLMNGIKGISVDGSTEFKATLDMGPFDIFNFSGLLLVNSIKYDILKKEHFTILYPEGYGDRFLEMANLLESGYSIDQESTGLNLIAPVNVTIYIKADWAGISIFWGNALGAGYHIEQAIRFPFCSPSIALRIFYHELGNLFVGGTKRNGPDDYEILNMGESFAPVLACEILEHTQGRKMAQWAEGADYLLNVFNTLSTGGKLKPDSGGIRLAEFYLRANYGMDIHKDFITSWTGNTLLKNLLIKAGFNTNETMVILYSRFAHENLAWLFRFCGFDIDDAQVDAGMAMTTTYNYTVSVNGVMDSSTHLYLDSNSQATLSNGQSYVINGLTGQHEISVDSDIVYGSDTRYVCSQNAITISNQGSHVFEYGIYYYLAIQSSDGGTTYPPSGWHAEGEQVIISASPSSGFLFTNWEGSGAGSYSGREQTDTITMNGPITEVATFQRDPTVFLIQIIFLIVAVVTVICILVVIYWTKSRKRPIIPPPPPP